MTKRILRDDSNPYGKKVWGVVDRAAERAPEFGKRKIDEAFDEIKHTEEKFPNQDKKPKEHK